MTTHNIISFPSLRQPEAWDPPILFDEWETPEISVTMVARRIR